MSKTRLANAFGILQISVATICAYRTLLRPSSLREPRYPSTRLYISVCSSIHSYLVQRQSKSHINDPSARSRTDTLLRLLLPLGAQVHRSNFSPKHPIGGSDGRCVQRAGTYSARADDSRLQGIPRSRAIITILYPNHGRVY